MGQLDNLEHWQCWTLSHKKQLTGLSYEHELLLRRKIPKKRRGNADKHGDAKTVRHRFFFGFFFDDCVKVQECICKTAFWNLYKHMNIRVITLWCFFLKQGGGVSKWNTTTQHLSSTVPNKLLEPHTESVTWRASVLGCMTLCSCFLILRSPQ